MTLEKVAHFGIADEGEANSEIVVCSFSRSGNYMAAALNSGCVKVWRCTNFKYEDIYTPALVWSAATVDDDSSSTLDNEVEYTTFLTFCEREDGEYMAAGTNLGRVYVWKLAPQEMRKNRFSPEIYYAAVIAEKVRTYTEGARLPILSVRFTPDSLGLITSTQESSKFWTFSHKASRSQGAFNVSLNPLKGVMAVGKGVMNVGKGVMNVGQNLAKISRGDAVALSGLSPFQRRSKKRVVGDRGLLEETVPWCTFALPLTLCSAFGFTKSYVFVAAVEEGNSVFLEPISVLPIIFWHKYAMDIPDADGTIPPILWLAQRKGNLNAIQRIVQDANTSMLYVTNDLEQVPYLFAVKCGDGAMMEYTSDEGKLEHFRDILGRTAVYFAAFNVESTKLMFTGSGWYTTEDYQGCPPLHYVILNGTEQVVSYVLFDVVAKLSTKEQRMVFESYDQQLRTPLMLLVEKYPLYARRIMDLYGMKRVPFESEDESVKVKTIYNTWLITPYKEKEHSDNNKTVNLMLKLDRKNLTSHPLVVYLFERKKWRGVVRSLFWLEFCLQLFIVAILAFALIFSNPRLDLGQFYTVLFTGSGWLGLRLAIIILALFDLAWRLFVPIRNLIVVRQLNLNYRMVSYLALYIALLM